MPKQVIGPGDVHPPIGGGYSHATRAGNTIYLAGQVALDRQGNLVGKGDIGAQAEQVYQNVVAVLKAAGVSFQDVVKVTTYLTRREDIPKVREVRARYFPASEPPASTLVVVSGLASPDFLIEVEAIAVAAQAG